MKKQRALQLVLIALVATSSFAQATRTWVSGVGDDVNPCSRTAPCKTFAGAVSKTAAGGEISVLDPGGFGTVTITKSLTIDGGGIGGSILSSGANGITVNDGATATPNTIEVIIRNITVDGAGNGLDGVRFIAGRRLVLENVAIFGMTGQGIEVATNVANAQLTLRNVSIDNTTSNGILVAPAGGNVFVDIRNSSVGRSRTTSGALFTGLVRAVISDSSFSGSLSGGGVQVSGSADVTLDHVRSTGNLYGVWHSSGAPVTRLKDCTLVGNSSTGAINGAGTMTGYNSNVIDSSSGVSSLPPV